MFYSKETHIIFIFQTQLAEPVYFKP